MMRGLIKEKPAERFRATLSQMPKVHRARQNDFIEVQSGDVLMKALQNAGIPVASSCGGDGVCCKCVLKVTANPDGLTPPTETELFLREQNDLADDVRVSCQAHIIGDVTVDARYW